MEDPNRGHSFDELARSLASGSMSRRRALKIFAAAVVGALVPSRALAQPCPSPKVEICHRPVGGPPKTLCVGPNAAQRHLTQHTGFPGAGPDTNGPCPPSPPSPPPGPPPPPCSERGDPCEGDRECCGDLECRGEPGEKRCRRRRDDPEDPR